MNESAKRYVIGVNAGAAQPGRTADIKSRRITKAREQLSIL